MSVWMQKGHEWMQVRTCHQSKSCLVVSGLLITSTAHAPHYYRVSIILKIRCSHAGPMDSWGFLHTCTRLSARYNWKRDSSDQEICFQSSTNQCRCWRAHERRKTLCRALSKGTRVGLRLRIPISIMFRRMVHTLTLADGPALKSAAICGRVALLSRWTILFSRRWSRSCRIFLRPQRSRRYYVLPDSRYSRRTLEMVIWKIPNASLPRRCCAPSLVRRL